jgi:hypothetical protein
MEWGGYIYTRPPCRVPSPFHNTHTTPSTAYDFANFQITQSTQIQQTTHSTNMSDHAVFLAAVVTHNPSKPNIVQLSAALDLTPAATSMRFSRLKKRLDRGRPNANDVAFLEKIVQYTDGKTDTRKVGQEVGLTPAAVSMRLTRLRKKWSGVRGNGRRQTAGLEPMDVEIKAEIKGERGSDGEV